MQLTYRHDHHCPTHRYIYIYIYEGCVITYNESLATCSLDLANKARHILFAMLFYIFMFFPGKAIFI